MDNEEVQFFIDNLKETKGGCAFVLKVVDRDLLIDIRSSETEPMPQCIDLDSQDVNNNNNNYDHRNNIQFGDLGSFEITAEDDEYNSDEESIVFDAEMEVLEEEVFNACEEDCEDDFDAESSKTKVRFDLKPKFHLLRVWKFAAKEARIDYDWKDLQHEKMRLQNI